MKHLKNYIKLFCVALSIALITALLTISTSAQSVRAGDGMIDTTAPGTGEFADDTSSDTGDKNSHGSPVESVIDGIVTDAEGAIDNTMNAVADGNMSIWGIVIAVVIIAAIVVLLFAFFSKRK